jgi:large subunit ribosomal protein L22
MEVTSTTKFVRLSPKKARDVAREIQGLPVSNALDILTFTPKKAAFLIGKTLKTAIADAENNFSLDTNSLVIKEAVIGAGPTMRRFKPRAKGSAGAIIKRTSHISITLVGAAPEKKKRAPKKAAAKKADKAPEAEAPATEEATA